MKIRHGHTIIMTDKYLIRSLQVRHCLNKVLHAKQTTSLKYVQCTHLFKYHSYERNNLCVCATYAVCTQYIRVNRGIQMNNRRIITTQQMDDKSTETKNIFTNKIERGKLCTRCKIKTIYRHCRLLKGAKKITKFETQYQS